jgi:hypothetical protein
MKQLKHLENTLATYVYSHCNICNIQMKHMQHPNENICNINLRCIRRRRARYPRSLVTGATNDAYRYGPVLFSQTLRAGHSLSPVTTDSHVTPCMHGPTRRCIPRERVASRAPKVDARKRTGAVPPNCNSVPSFLLGYYHAAWVGLSNGRTPSTEYYR